jgi:PDZ domain
MTRYLLSVALVLLALPVAWAQQPGDLAPPEEKGTYLGVLISAVPEILYDQLPELPRGQGVVVTHVLPDSPAAQAALQRHDVLLQYDDEKIRDCEHFARLIRADKPDRKVKLTLLRAGRRVSADVTLTLGPVLRIAQANRAASREQTEVARGTAKAGAPPSVSFAATPLEGGKMKVTIEYYPEGSGKLHSVTYEGTLEEIQTECKALPQRVQNLAGVALKRMRDLEFQPKDRLPAPANQK